MQHALRSTRVVTPDGMNPAVILIDGERIHSVSQQSPGDDVSVIDVTTGTVQGAPIAVGGGPASVAFTPDGETAYVAVDKPGTVDAAKQVGLNVAKQCLEHGIREVVFDRNGFLYHGRVRAVADGAREGGLKF